MIEFIWWRMSVQVCLTRATIKGPLNGEPSRVEQVLSSAGGIRTLVLSGSDVASYILALVPKLDFFGRDMGKNGWWCPMLDALLVHSHNFVDDFEKDLLCYLPGIAQRRKEGGVPLRSV